MRNHLWHIIGEKKLHLGMGAFHVPLRKYYLKNRIWNMRDSNATSLKKYAVCCVSHVGPMQCDWDIQITCLGRQKFFHAVASACCVAAYLVSVSSLSKYFGNAFVVLWAWLSFQTLEPCCQSSVNIAGYKLSSIPLNHSMIMPHSCLKFGPFLHYSSVYLFCLFQEVHHQASLLWSVTSSTKWEKRFGGSIST